MNENTTEGPLTATVGERLGTKARLMEAAVEQPPRRTRTAGRFPWAALLAASAIWLLVRSLTGATRGVGRRLRRRR